MTYKVIINRGVSTFNEIHFLFMDRAEEFDFAEMAASNSVARDTKVRIEFVSGGEIYE